MTRGIIIACSTPTTIASNVLMTKQSGGNEAAALVNAVIGNTIGVFISPLLIFAYLKISSSGSVQYKSIFLKLGLTVLVPLAVGQLIRFAFPNTVKKIQEYVNFSYINSAMLLLLVWSVFCDSFLSGTFQTISPSDTAIVAFIDLILFLFFSGCAYTIARCLGFRREDMIAIVMCGATKTVALGIPLISVIFNGDPNIGILSIPLLMYHALQLIIGSILVVLFVAKKV